MARLSWFKIKWIKNKSNSIVPFINILVIKFKIMIMNNSTGIRNFKILLKSHTFIIKTGCFSNFFKIYFLLVCLMLMLVGTMIGELWGEFFGHEGEDGGLWGGWGLFYRVMLFLSISYFFIRDFFIYFNKIYYWFYSLFRFSLFYIVGSNWWLQM